MELTDLLRRVVEVCEQLDLAYFVTGSTATTIYGDPGFTNDLDVVIDLPFGTIESLVAAFPDTDFYVSDAAVRKAVTCRGQFKVLHPSSGLKVDFMVASDSEFDRERLRRGRQMSIHPDRTVSVASPEDVVLKKMEYYREGGSEKHLRDIDGELQLQGERFDRAYVEKWTHRLGLAEIWTSIIERQSE